MGISLITASLVMLIMTGFIVVAIRQIAVALRQEMRADVIYALGVYDTLIEEKSLRLAEVNEQLNRINTKAAGINIEPLEEQTNGISFDPVAGLGLIAGAKWRDKNFAETYRTVHDGFQTDFDRVVDQIISENQTEGGSASQQILDTLSFETFCSLAVLDSEDQTSILRENLPHTSVKLLEEYQKRIGKFDSVEFYSYLKMLAKEESGHIQVRIGLTTKLNHVPSGVEVIKSKNICEGIQIAAGRTLYDYSISEREIS